eukprot:maker-scaffold698_size109766-snap-gene-0.18 protein:Tk05779 transcript:maker-scaffold698_size109766-snap-gene-0.18-mRNA-1 annotation:"hypothetical protein LOTGIDRAFT_235292"
MMETGSEVQVLPSDLSPVSREGGGGSGSSSDNESWIILDEEAQDEPAGRDGSEGAVDSTNDSDGEPVDRSSLLTRHTHISNLSAFTYSSDGPESVCSDGIPITEDDISDEKSSQYLWNTEIARDDEDDEDDLEISEDMDGVPVLNLLGQMNPTLNVSQMTLQNEDDPLFGEDSSDFDEDDLEIIPSGAISPKPNDLSTLYPTDELPDTYSKIQKGQTYSHQRKENVNYILTGLLIGFVVLTVGLGIGHFLGWSERLELQEQYADIREERLEALEDNLVSCMTGPEGQGLDDQDLDDRVIHQLWEENKDLKAQLEQLRSETELSYQSTDKVEEELSAILRDRLNDLLVANADLEKEVVRLRYSHGAIVDAEVSKVKLEESTSTLLSTKDSLNNLVHENDQLKLAIVKARYGVPNLPVQDKQRINHLQTENEELKKEVRRMRYGFPHGLDIIEPLLDDESTSNATHEDEGFFEDYIVEGDQDRASSSPEMPFFESFSELVFNTTEDLFGVDPKGFNISVASDILASFHKKIQKTWEQAIPSDEELDQIKELAQKVEQSLEGKWNDLVHMSQSQDAQKAKKTLAKLGKTVFETLRYAEDSLLNRDETYNDWIESWSQLQDSMEAKWTKIVDKLKAKPGSKAKKWKGDLAEEELQADDPNVLQRKDSKSSSRWSSKSRDQGLDMNWTFERAQMRKNIRKSEHRSDWVFDRANDRKRFHEFGDAEDWQSKRLLKKLCNGEDECHNILELNPSAINHGDTSNKKTSSKSRAKGSRRGDEWSFHDDLKVIQKPKERQPKRQRKIIDIEENFEDIVPKVIPSHPRRFSSRKNSHHNQKNIRAKSSQHVVFEEERPKFF